MRGHRSGPSYAQLMELQDEFEVTAVCDVSAGAAQYVLTAFTCRGTLPTTAIC